MKAAKVFSGVPPIKELLKRTEEHIKGMVVPGTLFEEMGFNYIGPVDGHDVLGLVNTLKNMRDLKGPQFLHIMTKKAVDMNRRKRSHHLPRGTEIRSHQRRAAEKQRRPAFLFENLWRLAVRNRGQRRQTDGRHPGDA